MSKNTLPTVTLQEIDAINALVDSLYGDPGFSDVNVLDVACRLDVCYEDARSLLSSLQAKGVVFFEKTDVSSAYDVVHLAPEWWHLHPEWWKVSQS